MSLQKIRQQVTDNYLIGCVKHGGEYRFFLEPVAWWIMDSVAYDPNFKQEEWPDAVFRNNVAIVDSSNAEEFINALSENELTAEEISKYNTEYEDWRITLMFYVDFDSSVFISNFSDIGLEDYIPDDWTGKFDDPVKHLPEKYSELLT